MHALSSHQSAFSQTSDTKELLSIFCFKSIFCSDVFHRSGSLHYGLMTSRSPTQRRRISMMWSLRTDPAQYVWQWNNLSHYFRSHKFQTTTFNKTKKKTTTYKKAHHQQSLKKQKHKHRKQTNNKVKNKIQKTKTNKPQKTTTEKNKIKQTNNKQPITYTHLTLPTTNTI